MATLGTLNVRTIFPFISYSITSLCGEVPATAVPPLPPTVPGPVVALIPDVVSAVDGMNPDGAPTRADGPGTGDFGSVLGPDASTAPAPMTRPATRATTVVPRRRKRGCFDIGQALPLQWAVVPRWRDDSDP